MADDLFEIAQTDVRLGETRDVTFKISEHYCGTPIHLPLRIIRGRQPGPSLCVTAAIHGDELNGTGIVRDLMLHPPELQRGTLVLAPVVNMLGFERHTRYMPDRRDLNRCFPGSPTGSLASRFAHIIFHQLVLKCEYLIDLHTAANFRINLPNVRTVTRDEENRRLAVAFGCRLVINSLGPEGSLRRTAGNAGIKALLFEGGEPWKIETAIVEIGARGIRNVLSVLRMTADAVTKPDEFVISHQAHWVRAEHAGLLDVHVKTGERVNATQPIATNISLLGTKTAVLRAPIAGIVMGLTTLPAVKPGDPVCHIAIPEDSEQQQDTEASSETLGK